ncbi:MAG: UbiD family decarboxylase [Dehalococcoidales bacterium]|nr:UbiD family decarboxylase [Dehalococcoidales bacterium]
MSFNDLRSWLEEVDKIGELKRIDGAHWDKEIGGISELLAERDNSALLFDQIPGYPEGYRVLSNAFLSHKRTASVLGIQESSSSVEMVNAFRQRLKKIVPVPPVEVETGPVKQNILTGDDIDLYKLPTPVWHEVDGGRYIGTGCAIISRDPDDGWINLGTYRCMIFDKNLMSVSLNPGKHGTKMMEKYHSRGEGFPLAVVCGMDPVLFMAAGSPLTGTGESEYDFAGYIKGEPVEITRGEMTDLPIPASAEIVIEGEIPPPERLEKRVDGPFGEWRRVYASIASPIMEVKSIMFRDNPIMLGVPPLKMHIPFPFSIPLMASEIWNVLEYAGIPDVTGVWFGLGLVWPVFCVISIKQGYSGHAKQAAIAAASCRANTVGGLFMIVVDDDIDITSEKDVIWAIANRANIENIQVINGIQTKAGSRKKAPVSGEPSMIGERVIIDACWPYELRDQRPVTSCFSEEYQNAIMDKFQSLFS